MNNNQNSPLNEMLAKASSVEHVTVSEEANKSDFSWKKAIVFGAVALSIGVGFGAQVLDTAKTSMTDMLNQSGYSQTLDRGLEFALPTFDYASEAINLDDAVFDNFAEIKGDKTFEIRSRDSAFLPSEPKIDRDHYYYTNVSVEGALEGSYKMEDATGIVFQPFEDAEHTAEQQAAYERYQETHSLFMANKL